jgi:hypothetical protein
MAGLTFANVRYNMTRNRIVDENCTIGSRSGFTASRLRAVAARSCAAPLRICVSVLCWEKSTVSAATWRSIQPVTHALGAIMRACASDMAVAGLGLALGRLSNHCDRPQHCHAACGQRRSDEERSATLSRSLSSGSASQGGCAESSSFLDQGTRPAGSEALIHAQMIPFLAIPPAMLAIQPGAEAE